jgi:hypothetical protein
LLFPDGVQNIAGAGDLRKVDLSLDFVAFGAAGTRRLCRAWRLTRSCAEMRPHFDGLVIFNRTGMRLLFGDPDFCKHVENRLAFDFQLSG